MSAQTREFARAFYVMISETSDYRWMKRLIHTLGQLALVLIALAVACATGVSQSGTTDALPNQKQPANASQLPPSPAVTQPAYLTPIAGYQGVLAETVEGTTIAAQAVDDKFNPASSVKLATTLVALQTLGPDHKFITGIWAAGSIDKSTGTLNGDLVVTGRDPSLHYEHAVMVARQLNELGIRTVTGNLIVTPSFTMNFDWSARHSGDEFLATLDSARRSASATRAWLDERTLIGDNASMNSVPSVVVRGQASIGSAPPGAVPILTHKSSRLVDVLKALLCYSNNFMAERIGDGLGGPEAISALLVKNLNLNPEELSLASASGVGVNRVTPRAMMKILRALRLELAKHKLSLSDILPVAGIDPGTLEERYTDPQERGSVIAKTGTLVRTDGGASSLVGQMRTKSGRIVLFVIMNQRGNVLRFRQNQDTIVTSIQNSLGGPAAFDYQPVKLAMRLANSEFEATKGRGEFEPKN
ncbi:MAG TPA: D-alanyl-D-alanine carboxypeptidase [Pyrinomonadaceae bacterium]|nr:D-alanyl-D-alanine carboxypeptidase [Pyrinomonadaceae bacterium]